MQNRYLNQVDNFQMRRGTSGGEKEGREKKEKREYEGKQEGKLL